MHSDRNCDCRFSRRDALRTMGTGFGMLGLANLLRGSAGGPLEPKAPHFEAKAKHVIFLFLNGGPSQVDTFDPKPMLTKYHGKPAPSGNLATERKTGNLLASPFQFKRYGKSGIEVSEIFPKLGECIDDICVIRSMYTDRPNHEPSLFMMNTGDKLPGRPSMGSWLQYGLGTENQNLPGFIVLCPGTPIVGPQLWSSTFLPAVYQGTFVPNNEIEPEKLIQHIRNKDLKPEQQRRQLDLIAQLDRLQLQRTGPDPQLEATIESAEIAFRMQDLGTVSIVNLPNPAYLTGMTKQVFQNNHWDLMENIFSAAGGSPNEEPVTIPAKIGAPSKIKHVFVIIRENRTYDQILGDVVGGNGDASLAVFGAGSAAGATAVTPNAHALVQRFPLLDNFYDPSRQSADGHNWIVQAMAPYSDDIQSPDWLRDYPSNGGDAIAYQPAGHLWDAAVKAGVSFKNYGEYIEYNTFLTPTGSTAEPQWIDFYNDAMAYEAGKETQLYNYNTVASHSPLPNLIYNTVQNYPQFDLGIPDQFRFDIWSQDFANDLQNGAVPQLEFMWISSDHTGGPPTAQAMQADNDLALGRFVDAISHSSIWSSSAIFVEEDDAQNGVDHVDGHRSPGYVISPFVKQQVNADGTGAGVTEDSTFYTQVNMTRTIEQILGIQPMNQFDLVASPMSTLFVENPPANNLLPWTHVPNQTPLTQGVTQTPAQPIPAVSRPVRFQTGPNASDEIHMSTAQESRSVKALRAGWMKMKAQIFNGKYHTPDSENSDVVNHLDWYEATGFTRPYPGESKVLPASAFKKAANIRTGDDDDR